MTTDEEHDDVRQERDVLPTGTITFAAVVTVAFTLILTILAVHVVLFREETLRPGRDFPEARLGPRREVSNVLEEQFDGLGPGERLVLEKRRELDRFRWVDRASGVVAVPIDAAIEIVAGEP